jgi:hypothetical protein
VGISETTTSCALRSHRLSPSNNRSGTTKERADHCPCTTSPSSRTSDQESRKPTKRRLQRVLHQHCLGSDSETARQWPCATAPRLTAARPEIAPARLPESGQALGNLVRGVFSGTSFSASMRTAVDEGRKSHFFWGTSLWQRVRVLRVAGAIGLAILRARARCPSTAECTAIGPTGTTFFNAADDPRNAGK